MGVRVVREAPLAEWEKNQPPPKHLAQPYKLGTVVIDDHGQCWTVEWDTQDHEHMWERSPELDMVYGVG